MLVFDGVHLRLGYKDLKIIFFNVAGLLSDLKPLLEKMRISHP
jgi:hypothetical protein